MAGGVESGHALFRVGPLIAGLAERKLGVGECDGRRHPENEAGLTNPKADEEPAVDVGNPFEAPRALVE